MLAIVVPVGDHRVVREAANVMQRCSSVDEYIERHPEHASALGKLRRILNATELEETVKWGAPCYTLAGKNVVGLGAFKDHVALWFHQGVFLKDPDGVLVNAQEGKTRGLRQWRFASGRDIVARAVKTYVLEAIENHKQGRTIRPRRRTEVEVPPALAAALAARPAAKRAFEALTPGRQREYAEHIASARQQTTVARRLEAILPLITAGVGLHDKYRRR